MVKTNYIQEISIELEHYLLRIKGYILDGIGYEVLLFVPVVRYDDKTKYSIILGSKILDKYSKKEVISDIYESLNQTIGNKKTSLIESIVVVNSNSPFVKNIRLIQYYNNDIVELNDYEIGGVNIYKGFLVNYNIAKKLKLNAAVHSTLINGDVIAMGIKSINKEDLMIEFYTGQGLREMFPRSGNDEVYKRAKELEGKSNEFLHENNYLDFIHLSEIKAIK